MSGEPGHQSPLPPGLAYGRNFARVVAVAGSRVEPAFDVDPAQWPWPSLPSQHPAVIEKYQYRYTAPL